MPHKPDHGKSSEGNPSGYRTYPAPTPKGGKGGSKGGKKC